METATTSTVIIISLQGARVQLSRPLHNGLGPFTIRGGSTRMLNGMLEFGMQGEGAIIIGRRSYLRAGLATTRLSLTRTETVTEISSRLTADRAEYLFATTTACIAVGALA